MKKVMIEWRHLDVEGDTCERCYETGETLKAEVTRLNQALKSYDVRVEWFETNLDAADIEQSNMILIGGRPIETIIDLKVEENFCSSCTDLVGRTSYCRSIVYNGKAYDDVPSFAIRDAVYKVLDIKESAIFSVV